MTDSAATFPDPWDGRRRPLLDAYFETLERIGELERDGRRDVANRLRPGLTRIHQSYVAGLPRRALSRDPFSGEPVEFLIDDIDLDGLFWDYEAPSRPVSQPVPATFFALTGAVLLTGEIASAPFLCKPGPEVPYVLPRILEHDDLRAVLSSFPVGPHRAFAIAYFADPIPSDLRRANEWGTGRYRFRDEQGGLAWESVNEDADDLDYELELWIRSGKLQWIAQGDPDLELRDSADDCPYLDANGHRGFTRIQDGEAWWPEDFA